MYFSSNLHTQLYVLLGLPPEIAFLKKTLQVRDRKHHSGKVQFQQLWVTEYNGRVVWGERGVKPWGLDQFVSHEKLLSMDSNGSCQYLKDDCLYFRVSSVKVEDMNKPWLMQTD